MSTTKSQNEIILTMLKNRQTVTPLTAYEAAGTLRLGGRIFELKELGHKIETEMVTVGKKRVASYRLEAQ